MDSDIVPVIDLFGKKFFIPSYQRGYRWERQQVEDLLRDINDFAKEPQGNFYCLQPLIVKKYNDKDDWYEVIDGQQRLTTLRLLLLYLSEMAKEEKYEGGLPAVPVDKIFILDYETRVDSKNFLNNPTKDQANKYIDFYHIFHAFYIIGEWFENQNSRMRVYENIYNVLIGDTQDKNSKTVKFIWYEVDEETDGIDIFTRINAGKIPLTNAELIKSLFLRQIRIDTEKYQSLKDMRIQEVINTEIYLKQLRIASEWDKIEIQLQDELFWSFIYAGKKRYDTRIEYIFALMTDTENDEYEYATFLKFSEQFKDMQDSQEEKGNILNKKWDEVKKYFGIFEECYNDHEMYHLIGYIVNVNIEKMITLIKKYQDIDTKRAYIEYLREIIGRYIQNKTEDISELSFPGDKDTIKHILLLHNLETIMDEKISYPRFPFHEYKKEIWSIEHIHAQNSDDIIKEGNFDAWVEGILNSGLGKQSSDYIKIKAIKESGQEIDAMVADIVKIFGEIDVDALGNLALLGKDINSGLGNDIFPIKRHKIIEYGKSGSFIPPCTRNVFLKYYSDNKKHVVNQLIKWEKDDGNAYIKDIKKKLAKYIDKDNGDTV